MRRPPLARINYSFGELIRISWRAATEPSWPKCGDCATKFCFRLGFRCHHWKVLLLLVLACHRAWCTICQAMRFQKLRAQIAACGVEFTYCLVAKRPSHWSLLGSMVAAVKNW